MYVPGWHEKTKALQDAGRFQMLGIIQEQHPDRARLFMQWKEMDWPILVDSLDLLEVMVVPITLAIDEHGVIRAVNPDVDQIKEEFLSKTYDPPASVTAAQAGRPERLAAPGADAGADAWRAYADALFRWESPARLTETIDAYERAAHDAPEDGSTQFRLGVAYRARYDSGDRQVEDFQLAVEHWERALDIDPNHYIRRRRIQQYGPRLDKPYPFYDWVPTARAELDARGEIPAALTVEPGGAEFASPARVFEATSDTREEPDGRGRIYRDTGEFIEVERLTVPTAIAAGSSTRAHLIFRPNVGRKAHWNNEVDDLVFWVEPPAGWDVDHQYLTVPSPQEVVSQEPRRVEFELRSPDNVSGSVSIPGYALYYVCEDVDGTCLYRRQDVVLNIQIK